jgi:hypothetical protein
MKFNIVVVLTSPSVGCLFRVSKLLCRADLFRLKVLTPTVCVCACVRARARVCVCYADVRSTSAKNFVHLCKNIRPYIWPEPYRHIVHSHPWVLQGRLSLFSCWFTRDCYSEQRDKWWPPFSFAILFTMSSPSYHQHGRQLSPLALVVRETRRKESSSARRGVPYSKIKFGNVQSCTLQVIVRLSLYMWLRRVGEWRYSSMHS